MAHVSKGREMGLWRREVELDVKATSILVQNVLSVCFIAAVFGFGRPRYQITRQRRWQFETPFAFPRSNVAQSVVTRRRYKNKSDQASDITQVIGAYLDVRRQGRNFVARCPWHDDSRPSMTINPGAPIVAMLGVQYRRRCFQLRDEEGKHRVPRMPSKC